MKELIAGIDAPIYRTASGNPATFSDADAANVKALSVTLTPTQSGSGNPSPTNIRPISGVSSVSVTRTGKNLLPLPLTRGAIVNGVDEFSFVRLRSGFIPCKPGEPVTLSLVSGTDGVAPYVILFYDANKVVLSWPTTMEGMNPFTATAPNNAHYCRIVLRKLDNANMAPDDVSAAQLEMNAAATDYEPYQGQTVTVQLTDGANPLTVYGGTLDVTTGALSVTWANIASYNGETLPGRWISDRDMYASGTTPTAGAQVIYELATPVTYQLTPQQLTTLHGYNAVSTDAASVSVTYKADTALVLGGAV